MTDIKISAEDRITFSKPDSDFNAKRNRDIIKRTIEKADKVREKKKKEYKEGLLERSDLIYSYISHIYGAGGNSNKTLYDYAGRENVMKLLGEQKKREIMQRKFIYGQNNNYIKE